MSRPIASSRSRVEMMSYFRGTLFLFCLLAGRASAEEITFGASYDRSYDPLVRAENAEHAIWKRGTSTLAIRPNQDGATAASGVATFDDNRKDGRIQLSVPLRGAFGRDPARMEYCFNLRVKFYAEGLSMPESAPPLAVVVAGFRDEHGATGNGRSVLLGFFVDIDPTKTGAQPGLGLVDDETRLVREVVRWNFADAQFHTYTIQKYLRDQHVRLRVVRDGVVLGDEIPYLELPMATKNSNGFGYFTSTPGTICASVGGLSFGQERKRSMLFVTSTDWRDIENGHVIQNSGYADQPYLVRNADASLTCLLTLSNTTEGSGLQHVAATRSEDGGRTWSQPVPLEPIGSPENSWAIPILTPSGRIYAAYTFNYSNMRAVKWETGELNSRVDSLGKFVMRYSDDQGRTWSTERFEIPMRTTEYDRENIYKGDVNGDGTVDDNDAKFFWTPSAAVVIDGTTYLGITKIRNFRAEGAFAETEGFVLRSENLLLESDPSKVTWDTVPEGRFGLRSRGGITCEELTPVALSNGVLGALCRTTEGVILGFYSSNRGDSWSSPEPLKYALDRRPLKNPRAKPAIWSIGHGRYLLWFENNGHKGYEYRNPSWVAVGIEREGRLLFSQPEILLYSRDDHARMSYPDLIEYDGRYLLTETQKSVARIHPIKEDIIRGLLGQGTERRVVQEGLLASWSRGDSAQWTVPSVPNPTQRGFSFEFWLKGPLPRGGLGVLASEADGGDGFSFSVNEAGKMGLIVKQGQTGFSAWSDSGALKPQPWNHIVCIVEPGPRIVMWVVNGRLSDGGDEAPFGWTRFPVELNVFSENPHLQVAAKPKGYIQQIRFYDRPLTVSEAISNYNHGPTNK